jgi:hypothetical protein
MLGYDTFVIRVLWIGVGVLNSNYSTSRFGQSKIDEVSAGTMELHLFTSWWSRLFSMVGSTLRLNASTFPNEESWVLYGNVFSQVVEWIDRLYMDSKDMGSLRKYMPSFLCGQGSILSMMWGWECNFLLTCDIGNY